MLSTCHFSSLIFFPFLKIKKCCILFCFEGQATAFAGGLVKAMEWCPLDEDSTRGQVLAVAAGRVMWEGQEVFRRKEGPGLIQFWSAGTLDSRE